MCGAPNCDGQFHHMAVVRDAKSLEIVRSLPFLLDLSPDQEEELLQHGEGQSAAEELERCPDLVPARAAEPTRPAEPEEKPVTPAWWSDRERDDD